MEQINSAELALQGGSYITELQQNQTNILSEGPKG